MSTTEPTDEMVENALLDRAVAALRSGAAPVPPSEDVGKLIEHARDHAEDEAIVRVDLDTALAALRSGAAVPVETGGPQRLDPDLRADLIDFARDRIEQVWADVPGGVDAATLASNVVAAQEFCWMSRQVPVVARVETVTTVEELPVGSVFWGYYYPPAFSRPLGVEPELARQQLTRGRSIVHGERMEYPLTQPWERIEVLFRPDREEGR